MSIGRISGALLYNNLERQGVDLRFEGNLIYLDVNQQQTDNDGRVGIKTDSPQYDFDVNGEARFGNIVVSSDSVLSLTGKIDLGTEANLTIGGGTSGYVLSTDGSGTLSWQDIGTLAQATDATGMQIILGSPTDGSLTANASYQGWTESVTITDAIDDLNQISLNIAKGTYVGQANFTSNVVAGPSPQTVQFTGSYVGTANSYFWDFGDGSTSTNGPTVTHTYDDVDGGTFTVSFRAYNVAGTLNGDPLAGARGSVDDEIKPNYFTLYTPTPISSLFVSANEIDSGQGILIGDDSLYATSYFVDWGDGNTLVPDPSWTTESHTYTNVGGDTQYDLRLDVTSATAGPSPVTVQGEPYPIKVYSEHEPEFTANTIIVINELVGGGTVSFDNTTATDPGETATFTNNRYRWIWGDSNDTEVNIATGVAGNPLTPIEYSFSLSAQDQLNGVTQEFSVQLEVINGHSQSPFLSLPTVISVEPDVRADFSIAANVVSDRTGDSNTTGYVYTDYFGQDRAEFVFSPQTQHAETYTWSWGDTNSLGPLNEGDPGTTTGGNITYSYTTTGTKNVNLSIAGTPDTIAQTDSKTRSLTIAANPAAPANLSAKTLAMSTTSQGTNPRLVYNATNNSGGAMPAAGSAVTRYTSGTVVSNTITDANTSVSGTLAASINDVTDGSVTFDTASDKSGTYTSLIVVNDQDAHLAISSNTYPTGFYKVFDARISKSISSLPVGYNTFQLTHSIAGSTNTVGFVSDDVTVVPTVDTSAAVLTEKTSGTYRYISGVPYYNTGGVVTASGITVTDWIGQTYYNGNPLTVIDGDDLESTSGTLITTQSKSYSDIDGVTTYLSSGIPIVNTGNGSTYALGNFDININGSTRAVGYLRVNLTNVNGTSTAQQISTPINVYSASVTGVNEESIAVPVSLGGTYTDAGRRVIVPNTGGANDATPTFNSSINYYTSQAFTGAATVAGTNEAVTRWGVIKNVTTNFTTYLPPGPNLATGRTGYQYFTFAFRRTTLANFDIILNGKISGLWIAAPGTDIDITSTLNGWLDATVNYTGSGVPGANTAAGGNGTNGCAVTSSDRIPTGTAINGSYTVTLGGENLSNATGNVCLVRIQLATTDYVNSISIGAAA
jgi:PKD repeat protein